MRFCIHTQRKSKRKIYVIEAVKNKRYTNPHIQFSFRRVRKILRKDYQPRHVCPNGATQLPLYEFLPTSEEYIQIWLKSAKNITVSIKTQGNLRSYIATYVINQISRHLRERYMKHGSTRAAEETDDDRNRIQRHTEAICMPDNSGQKSNALKYT